MQYKIFTQRTIVEHNREFIEQLMNELDLSYITAALLNRKGVCTIDEASRYLCSNEKYLNNPFLFDDMNLAVERIEQARDRGENILIYGDYDCDGVTSSTILYKALKSIGCNVSVYLPDRFTDGYGMTIESITRLIDNGANLIITVDNGITAFNEIEHAKTLGVDVILTDHHTPPEVVPNAYAIINPKTRDESYPFNDLCGASVALKIAFALNLDSELLDELTVFASIGTIADLVSLVDENRVIASLGLEKIKNCKNLGLNALIKKSDLNKKDISCGNVSFQLAPRINAIGRLYSAMTAFELFTADSEAEANRLADKLCSANDERKSVEEEITRLCENIVREENLLEKQNVLFIKLGDENEGVIGIVAGKIAEKYNRPTVVCCEKNSIVKASARSIARFNIYDCLNSVNELYIKFGGHSQAAGFSIDISRFDELVVRANQYAVDNDIKSILYRTRYYDIVATPSMLSKKSILEVEKFAPFGIKNSKPVFKLENVHLRNLAKIGKLGVHLRCNVVFRSYNLSAVAFSQGYIKDIENVENKTFDIMFSASIDNYRNKNEIKLEIKDLQEHITVPNLYYQSLYALFNDTEEDFTSYELRQDEITNLSFEGCLKNKSDSVFVVYGNDALNRATRYAITHDMQTNISYSTLNSFAEGKINILVNPLSFNDTYNHIFLDNPCYFGYNGKVLSQLNNKLFLPFAKFVPEVNIDREYVVFIYKRLRMLDSLNRNIYSFIDYLNNDSVIEVNYFTFTICLDVMSDMGILGYCFEGDKVEITYNKISEKKDINQSATMKKLYKGGY